MLFKKAPNIMKDIFPIGVWFDGAVDGINCPDGYHDIPRDKREAEKHYEAYFTDIKNHGIDIVVIPNTPPDYREILLSVADKVGVKIVLELVESAGINWGGDFCVRNLQMVNDEQRVYEYYKKVIDPLRHHPSLFCYQVLDEPSSQLFANFQLVKRVLEHMDPAHPSFSCLCRENELDRTSRMGTQMMVFDRYPLWKNTKPGEYDFQQFIKLLQMLKSHATEIPYWMVGQTCAMDREGGLRYPLASELRLMVYLSLAHNAKGIFFFLHNSYTQQERLQGLVDTNLKPHPLYLEAAKLAGELKTLAPVILEVHPAEDICSFEGDFDVQAFTHTSEKHYLFICNLDVLDNAIFNGKINKAKIKDIKGLKNILHGGEIAFQKKESVISFSLDMKPGEGAILEIVD